MIETNNTSQINNVKVDDGNIDFNYDKSPSEASSNNVLLGKKDDCDIPIRGAVYVFVLCAALNSCNLGFDIGVNTGAAKLIQDDLALTDRQIEIFLGSLNLFSIFGALGAYLISDYFGRRKAFVLAAILFIVGTVIVCIAQNYEILIIGRMFLGLGVGFGLAIDPLYISEISPACHRGQLVTWSEFALNIGIVLGFASGIIFSGVPANKAWRYMFGLGAILPSILLIFVSFVMPESPRWLMANEREEEALSILRRIYPQGFQVELIAKDIRESLVKEALAENTVGWGVIFFPTPAFRRMLLVGISVAIAQQAVGIDAIQYYMVYILEESGISDRTEQNWTLIFLGLLKLFCIVIAGYLFDMKGRRPLIFLSLIGMMFALLMQSINFLGSTKNNLTIICLSTYLIFFSLGMGPGAWLIPSEVFSTLIRAKAMSLATFMNRIVATIMSSSFLTVATAITWSGFFLLLACICLIILVFFFFLLPETNGKSLEQMSVYFAEITGDRSILDIEESYKAKQRNLELENTRRQGHVEDESSMTIT